MRARIGTRRGMVKGENRRRSFLIGAAAVLGVALLALAVPRSMSRPPLSAEICVSTAVYDREKTLLRLTLASDEVYRLWVPLRDIPPVLKEAVLFYEDRHFYRHPGVNPISLARGFWRTFVLRDRRMGGSTITMQLARRLWRLDTGTAAGKVMQILRALELEMLRSKDEILEAYLNLAPYGSNIEGVGAASLIYFGKPARSLTTGEAAALTVIPQDPSRRQPNGKGHAEMERARGRLLNAWLLTRGSGDEEARLARLPVTFGRNLPFHAPHWVATLLADRAARLERELVTTLDLQLQRLLERHIQAYILRVKRLGIRNACALLVDWRDMGVRALVGSADFFDEEIHGQVNGVLAKRSPGSTLKPFIYALAMDQGLLHPATVIKDTPQSFGPYCPENFDGQFVGPLTATDALIRSRNVPAITVAAQLTQPTLYEFLKQGGVSRLKTEEHYGLALVLGGGDVTMEELVRLYALLANRGELRPLRYLEGVPRGGSGVRLLSEEACFLVMDMLRQNPRPGEVWTDIARVPVSWKTGTSYGFRDAWTVGVFGPYALAVWLGSFDASPNPSLIGIHAAAPLFFEIVDSIAAHDRGLHEPPRPFPRNLTRVEVCSASGQLPNPHCPVRRWTWFIPGKSPIRVDEIHRELIVDLRTGRQACPPHDTLTTRREVYEFWGSDMLRVFQQAGLPRRQPPPRDPSCVGFSEGGASPIITSPRRGLTYTLRLSRGPEAISLHAEADADARDLYWFVNDAYLGKAPRGGSLQWLPPGPGAFQLRVADDQGRAQTREVHVAVVD